MADMEVSRPSRSRRVAHKGTGSLNNYVFAEDDDYSSYSGSGAVGGRGSSPAVEEKAVSRTDGRRGKKRKQKSSKRSHTPRRSGTYKRVTKPVKYPFQSEGWQSRGENCAPLEQALALAHNKGSAYGRLLHEFVDGSDLLWTFRPPSIRFKTSCMTLNPIHVDHVSLTSPILLPPAGEARGPSAMTWAQQVARTDVQGDGLRLSQECCSNHAEKKTQTIFIQMPSEQNRNALQRRLFVRFTFERRSDDDESSGTRYMDLELRVVNPAQYKKERDKDLRVIHQAVHSALWFTHPEVTDLCMRLSYCSRTKMHYPNALAHELTMNLHTGVVCCYVMPWKGSVLRCDVSTRLPLNRMQVQLLKIDNNRLVEAESYKLLSAESAHVLAQRSVAGPARDPYQQWYPKDWYAVSSKTSGRTPRQRWSAVDSDEDNEVDMLGSKTKTKTKTSQTRTLKVRRIQAGSASRQVRSTARYEEESDQEGDEEEQDEEDHNDDEDDEESNNRSGGHNSHMTPSPLARSFPRAHFQRMSFDDDNNGDSDVEDGVQHEEYKFSNPVPVTGSGKLSLTSNLQEEEEEEPDIFSIMQSSLGLDSRMTIIPQGNTEADCSLPRPPLSYSSSNDTLSSLHPTQVQVHERHTQLHDQYVYHQQRMQMMRRHQLQHARARYHQQQQQQLQQHQLSESASTPMLSPTPTPTLVHVSPEHSDPPAIMTDVVGVDHAPRPYVSTDPESSLPQRQLMQRKLELQKQLNQLPVHVLEELTRTHSAYQYQLDKFHQDGGTQVTTTVSTTTTSSLPPGQPSFNRINSHGSTGSGIDSSSFFLPPAHWAGQATSAKAQARDRFAVQGTLGLGLLDDAPQAGSAACANVSADQMLQGFEAVKFSDLLDSL